MGIYDRDYYRTHRPSPSVVGQMRMWSVTTWLIVINIAVFLLDPLLVGLQVGYPFPGQPELKYPPLWGLGHFSLSLAVGRLEVWRFITFQFLHAGLAHLAFNMISLYFFGPLIEAYLGSRRYLIFYLVCGIGGPIAYFMLWLAGVLIASPWIPLVGASAGIFGVLMAAAQVAPNATVLIYGIFPMRLKTLAWVLLGISIYTVLSYGESGLHNAGGEAAHLGGAAFGWMLIRNPTWLNVRWLPTSRRRKPPF